MEDPSTLALLGDRAADTKEDLDEKMDWESRLEDAAESEQFAETSSQSTEDENLLKE